MRRAFSPERAPTIALLSALAGAAADQWLKSLAQAGVLSTGNLIPGLLDGALVYNRGAALGFLGQWSAGIHLLSAISALVSVALVLYLWRKRHEPLLLVAIACVLAGALGNLYDRITLGHVVDYLHLHLGSFSLFVFNLADFLITLGAVLWFWVLLQQERR